MFYLEIFVITTALSAFFALGGVGSATALVPIMHFLGIEFNFAKAIGLFVNSATTITATIMNLKRGVLDIKFALPMAITLLISSPFGAYFSKFIDPKIVKWLFVIFLIFSATMILFVKKREKIHLNRKYILIVISFIVGVISGLLGIGGGSILMPILILFGFDAKKLAVAMSFVIPFSTISAFLTYMSFVKFDWNILIISAIGAIIGGYIGNYFMHFKLNQAQIKKIIAILLYLIAIKMGSSLI
ncbi:MAG: sulfite exporter TauE/SafE family protein [Epsilonproteobacteria bacterium]|nr:sulfite exporter TauE/SafE family protein [Campylobacterota bacterium]